MMKRMLCSLMLLIAASMMTLIGSANYAKAAGTPVAFTNEIQRELHGTLWKGKWYTTDLAEGVGSDGGSAELYLKIVANSVNAKFSIKTFSVGSYSYWAEGKTNGNTITLERKGRTAISLSLYREGGRFVLRGKYESLSGKYEGEVGSYNFKIVK